MNLRTMLQYTLIITLAASLTPAVAESKDVFRLAHSGAPNEDYAFGAEQFAANLARLSNG